MNEVVDKATFDRLLLEHLPAAQRFAIRLTGNPSAAEDLMQDALLRAHRGWQSFRGDSRFTTWLFQIVVNCFRDRLRHSDTAEPISNDLADRHALDPSRQMEGQELGERVAAEISKLPPRQREVLVLIAYEQLSIGEVAAMLKVNEQNVRTNLHLARERLRQRLQRYLEP